MSTAPGGRGRRQRRPWPDLAARGRAGPHPVHGWGRPASMGPEPPRMLRHVRGEIQTQRRRIPARAG